MSYIRKIIQQRLNTGVDFYTPADNVVAKLEEYKASGKIESYSLNILSENTLVKTILITFKDTSSFDEFIGEDVILSSKLARAKHCENNLISTSLEEA